MKYVPSLPPPVTGVETGLEVKALARVKRAKPVQARTLPPLVVQPHARHEAPPEVAGNEEKRHDPHVHGERRIYCRRIEHLPILVELRSGIDRHRHNQRAGDIAEHIDESLAGC
ncbi:MAG: hypothetical protein Q8O58_04535 [Gallionella sp.]|nr:hypothetical protein [Gallionella sp.]